MTDTVWKRPDIRYISCESVQKDGPFIQPFCEAGEDCLFLITSGSLSVRIRFPDCDEWVDGGNENHGENDIFLRNTDLLLLSENTVYSLSAEKAVTYYRICYSGGSGFVLPKRFRLREPTRVLQSIQNLLYYGRNAQYPPVMRDCTLCILLGEIDVQSQAEDIYPAGLCERICLFIQDNADKPITIRDIARHFDYNPVYLSRLFRKSYPRGLQDYLITERINCIKYYLLTTDYPLKELSKRLHFPDYKQFLKYFKYHEGVSPTEFRHTAR